MNHSPARRRTPPALPLALSLALALALAGPVRAQQPGAADRVVATVNGAKVMLSDVRMFYDDLEEAQEYSFESVFRPLLDRVIQTRLLAAQARADGLDRTPAVAHRLRTMTERVLHHAWLEAHVRRSVTDEQVAAAYKAFAASHDGEEQVRARHILLKTREEAQAAIEALEKGGDFAELARTRSTGPSKAQGGDLGWFPRRKMVKPFADAAFALEKGAFTAEPVQTQFGWHVILVVDRRKVPPSFEESRDGIRLELSRQAMAAAVERLVKAAEIERFGPDGKPLDDAAADPNKDGQDGGTQPQ